MSARARLWGESGWTGAQYSVFRAVLGGSLAVGLLLELEPAAPTRSGIGAALALGGLAAVAALALGLYSRAAAVASFAALVLLSGLEPQRWAWMVAHLGAPLLLHAGMPRGPFGSLDAARGWNHAWRLPRTAHAAAWTWMVGGYAFDALTRLAGSPLAPSIAGMPTEVGRLLDPTSLPALPGMLVFGALAPLLALRRPLRPWLWLVVLAVQLAGWAQLSSASVPIGPLALLAWTFDPAWIPPRLARGTPEDRVYFDSECGLCQRSVRFILSEDGPFERRLLAHPEDATSRPAPGVRGRFRFAPLGGTTFERRLGAEARASLPDSLVVETASGRLLTRSDAVIRVLERLGGLWRGIAQLIRLVPRSIRDAVYDGIAARRPRRTGDACPFLPPDVTERFDP